MDDMKGVLQIYYVKDYLWKKIIYINHNILQTKLVRYYFESSSKKYMYKFCIGIKFMLKNNVANILVKNYVIKLYV